MLITVFYQIQQALQDLNSKSSTYHVWVYVLRKLCALFNNVNNVELFQQQMFRYTPYTCSTV